MAAVSRLTRKLSEERASLLAAEAVELARSGNLQEATTRLREAARHGHDNPDVQAALIALHDTQNQSPLVGLCRRYAQYHDDRAGQDAVAFLRSSEAVTQDSATALESIQLLLAEAPNKLSSIQDGLISELGRQHAEVRRYIVSRLIDSTTLFFENMFARGDDCANLLRGVVLEAKLWPNEETRFRVEDDLFVLFIAKLMESGHDHDGRALKGITLLLLADTARLQNHIDEDAFDALLGSLDYRLPAAVRGQATLVISRFMEASEVESQKYLSTFITSQVAKQKSEALIVAFSAAAQLFTIATNITAQLFLTEGFLPAIMPHLQERIISAPVHDAFLILLNSACIDATCRKAIQENAANWLSHKVSNGTGRQPAMAATILAKIRTAPAQTRTPNAGTTENVSDLVDLFQASLIADTQDKNISDSIEGLAYTSLRPEVKEQIASNTPLLTALLAALEAHPSSPEITIGGLSILANLTHYAPALSEEQRKMSQLRAYANATQIEHEDDDSHVEARCKALVAANVVSVLVKLNKTPSSGTSQLTDKILLSLSRTKTDRGKIAQQGAVKLLILHCQRATQSTTSLQSTQPLPSPQKSVDSLDAAHALARILISLNPSHVFSGNLQITSAIPPLVSLLKSDTGALDNTPRDLLPVFESLLALTNLASSPNQDVATGICKHFDLIEDLILSSNVAIRRAAVELVCNLAAFPAGMILYADGSRRALERLRILVAMGDVDDAKTRSASGGALAMLSDIDQVRTALVNDEKINRTAEVVLEMITDVDLGIKHRGFVILGNLMDSDKVKEIAQRQGGVEKIKEALKNVREQEVLEIGVRVLKVLMGK